MKLVATYPWLTSVVQFYAQLAERDRLPHAFLFTGPNGLGQTELLHYLANGLLCPQNAIEPCGSCAACHLTQAGTHPDKIALDLADSQSIGVDMTRQVIQQLGETAYQSGARVVVIPNVQRMTENAANALLKTLEEPGENTFLLLSAPSLHGILPTIVSRCQTYAIAPPAESEALQWLAQQNIPANRLQLRLNHGAPLACLQAHEQGTFQQLDSFVSAWHSAVRARELQPLIQAMQDAHPHALDWLQLLLLDTVKQALNAEQHRLFETDTYQTELDSASQDVLVEAQDLILQSRQKLLQPGLNLQLQYTDLIQRLVQSLTGMVP